MMDMKNVGNGALANEVDPTKDRVAPATTAASAIELASVFFKWKKLRGQCGNAHTEWLSNCATPATGFGSPRVIEDLKE